MVYDTTNILDMSANISKINVVKRAIEFKKLLVADFTKSNMSDSDQKYSLNIIQKKRGGKNDFPIANLEKKWKQQIKCAITNLATYCQIGEQLEIRCQ